MLTLVLVVGGVVVAAAVVVKVFGKAKVEAELKTVETKVVDEVKKL